MTGINLLTLYTLASLRPSLGYLGRNEVRALERDWLLPVNISECRVSQLDSSNPKKCYRFTLGHGTELRRLRYRYPEGSQLVGAHRVLAEKTSSWGYILGKTFQSQDGYLMSRLIKTLVRPLLEYAVEVFNPILVDNVVLLKTVQRRYTKRSPGFYNYDEWLLRLHGVVVT